MLKLLTFLEENTEEFLCDLGLDKDFLGNSEELIIK